MNLQQDRTSRIKARNAIMVLAIISIATYFISNLLYNVIIAGLQTYGIDYYINFINNIQYFIQFFQLLRLELAAALLLLVFVIASKRENKHEILVPVIFGFIAVEYLLYVPAFFGNADYDGLLFVLFFGIHIVAMCVMSVISSIKGMKQKVFPIIVIAIRSLLVLIFAPNALINAFETSSGRIILYATSVIGAVSCFYAALLIFVITNRIPALVGEKQEMQQAPQQVPQYEPVQDPQPAPQQVPQYVPVQDPQQAPQQIPQQMYFQQPQQYQQPQQQITYQPLLPEQELAILDDQLRRGMITFEVYQSKRDQIINKLKRF